MSDGGKGKNKSVKGEGDHSQGELQVFGTG